MSSEFVDNPQPVLEVRNLVKVFSSPSLLVKGQPVVTARGISFRVLPGEAVALVGEPGSGKTTVAKALLRRVQPDGGQILLYGQDLLSRRPQHAAVSCRRRVQQIMHDPATHLDPGHDIATILTRSRRRPRGVMTEAERELALDLLHQVGLEPAEAYLGRRPVQLSADQRQRVCIACALATQPDLLVANELDSLLDETARKGILTLLKRVKRERALAMVYITRDLAAARLLADRILILYRGRVVEDGPADAVATTPAHPHTRDLAAAIAAAAATDTGRMTATGDGGSRAIEPETSDGCAYAARCAHAQDICRSIAPVFATRPDRRVRCHLYNEPVELTGS